MQLLGCTEQLLGSCYAVARCTGWLLRFSGRFARVFLSIAMHLLDILGGC